MKFASLKSMKNKNIIISILIALVCVILIHPLVALNYCYASESDVYTYSTIPLRDAAPEVNKQFNKFLTIAINSVLSPKRTTVKDSDVVGTSNIPDNEIEYRFVKYYESYAREALWNSKNENCIISNKCEGWAPIDRIILLPGESVYDRSDYNSVTKNYLSPIINLCGFRIGTDKITHMLEDGFRLYNYWMNQADHLTDTDLLRISYNEEQHMMGRNYTEVVSFGDIFANMAGVRLFRDLFYNGRLVHRDANGKIQVTANVDFCDYAQLLFDERVSSTEYTGERADKILQLIHEKISRPDQLTNEKIAEILARNGKEIKPENQELIEGLVIAVAESALHPTAALEQSKYLELKVFPINERRPINLSKNLDFPEPEQHNFIEYCQNSGGTPEFCQCTLGKVKSKMTYIEYKNFEIRIVLNNQSIDDKSKIETIKSECKKTMP